MRKKHDIDPEDIDAFLKAVKGTKVLVKKEKIRLSPPTPPLRKPTKNKLEKSVTFQDNLDIPAVQGEELITYKQSSVSNKILRKLRKGQYNVEAMLDLHGMTVEEAKIAIESFLQQCLQLSLRVVLIIHGKGHHSDMPILKNKLNQWLRETNKVLAFCSAAQSHGSRGATYVLLKRPSIEFENK
jgi:DNA-nicking Smr family endonuclease